MSDKIEYSRLLMKRSTTTGEVPTIPPITAVTLNQFTPTDIFEGEFFLNSADDLLWIRTENGILPISLSGSTGSTGNQTLTQVLFEGNVTNGYDIVVSSGDTIVFEGLNTGVTTTILGLDSTGGTITTTISGAQDLEGVLTVGNTTGLNDIFVSSGASIIYEYLPTGSTNQYLALDADGRTIKTTASPSGDSLWTSGSSVGSVVTVAGSNTNTAKYTLIAGESNTVSQTHSTGVTSGNIVIGKNNVVDGNSIAVFGINNSVSNSVYNIAQGAGNIIYGGLYNGVFGGNHVISGGSYNYILGGILNKMNPSGSNFSRSAIIGGALNVIDGSGGLAGSVILGGQGITATTSNMTYVPNLTIVSATTGTSVANLSIDSTGKVIKSTGGPSNPYLQQEITIPSGNTNTTVSTNLNGSNGNFFLFNIVADTSNWTSANRTLIIQLTGITNFVNGTPIYIGLNIQHLTTGSTSNDYLNVFVTDISTDTNLTECAVYARATYSSSISYPINTWGSYLYGFNRGTLSVVKNNRIQ